MSILKPGVICSAASAREYAASIFLSTEVELQLDIAADINTAVESGLFTEDSSVSGESSADIQAVMNLLSQLGYTVSLSSTTLTISWF